jgi:hypothetical protein
MMTLLFLALAPCRLAGRCKRFREIWCLHLKMETACFSETLASTDEFARLKIESYLHGRFNFGSKIKTGRFHSFIPNIIMFPGRSMIKTTMSCVDRSLIKSAVSCARENLDDSEATRDVTLL